MTGTNTHVAVHKLGPKIQTLIDNVCRGKKQVKLTIGIFANEKKSIKVFDTNGEIPNENHIYEIGSVTKTFTGSLLAKQIHEGKMSLDDSIDKYIDGMDKNTYYPTLKRLATHTAGYPGHLSFNSKWDYIKLALRLNDSYNRGLLPFNVDFAKMKRLVVENKLKNKDYSWQYSNLGIALVGYAIGVATGMGYWDAMNGFLSDELNMKNSYTGTCPEKNLQGVSLKNVVGNWDWNKSWGKDFTAPAGDISATAEDMLEYAKISMYEDKPYLALAHQKHAEIKKFGKVAQAMGLGWVILPDKNFQVITHTGGTSAFISNVAIDKEKKVASVSLINYCVSPVEIYKLNIAILEVLQKN